MKFIKNNSYLLLVVMLCILFTVVGLKKMETEIVHEKVIVADGDTLWDYASLYAKHIPRDKWIKETIQLNDLTSATIRIGDELRLPRGKSINHNEIATQIAGDKQ